MITNFHIGHILPLFILLTSFLSASVSYAQDEPKFPEGDFGDMRNYGLVRVIEVVTPQTLKLSNGEIVNLTGIRLPDYTVEYVGPFAQTTFKILKDMVEGQEMNMYRTKDQKTGRKNRLGHSLAHLEKQQDKAWVQGTLVRLGLVQARPTLYNPEMAAQLYALEAQARAEKLGIWSSEVAILTPDDAQNKINSFQIVEGRIRSAAIKQNRIYLNFGHNWRTDFTVTVAPENRKHFIKGGFNPLDWNGRRVRVRGWVQEYNGAMIEIDHPSALEILEPEKTEEKTEKKAEKTNL